MNPAMCRVFLYIAFMEKGVNIAFGLIFTIVIFYTLAILINAEDYHYYFIVISSLICLTTGVILIKKGRYKNFGIGVISALISFYLFFLILCWMMSGPM